MILRPDEDLANADWPKRTDDTIEGLMSSKKKKKQPVNPLAKKSLINRLPVMTVKSKLDSLLFKAKKLVDKDKGQPCEQGETAARSGCIPADGPGGQKPSQGQQQGGNGDRQGAPEASTKPQQSKPVYAPAPEGETITKAPCCLYRPDPAKVNPKIGIPDHSRVGVPSMDAPPPPKEIPRLPRLTENERKAESRFADAYLKNPDAMVSSYRKALQEGKIGDAPNVFNTDDAKMLSPDYNPSEGGEDAVKDGRGNYNAAVHQTANAIAKRAFLQHLDEVVSKLPEGERSVLVTSGGVAAGKGYALKNVDQTKDLAGKVGAIWDAAGEQNATENPWVLEECKKRGIKPIFAFIHANPTETWENPARGVVERANKIGRMVDARLFADSYTLGAKNFHEFHQKHKDSGDADFVILDNSSGAPKLTNQVPEAALKLDGEALYARASSVLKERADKLRPSVVRGGSIGQRVWGEPQQVSEKAMRTLIIRKSYLSGRVIVTRGEFKGRHGTIVSKIPKYLSSKEQDVYRVQIDGFPIPGGWDGLALIEERNLMKE